jgi:hypothetical protein
MANKGVFISYRRSDAGADARSIYQGLERTIGRGRLFMDVNTIAKGTNFRAALDQSLATSGVLLAIIGPGWLDARDEAGRRRLDDADDFVRREIAAALSRGMPVVPVLVEGARLPAANDLPLELRGLLDRQSARLTHETFDADMAVLTDEIMKVVGRKPPSARLVATLALAVAVLGAGYVVYTLRWGRTAALALIHSEIEANFAAVSNAVGGIHARPPLPFYRAQRASESDEAYSGEVLARFDEYARHIGRQLQQFTLANGAFDAGWRSIGDEALVLNMRTLNERLKTSREYLISYEAGLHHLMRLTSSPAKERDARAQSLHREKIAQARIHLARAASTYCYVEPRESARSLVATQLRFAGVVVSLTPAKDCRANADAVADRLFKDNREVFEARVEEGAKASAGTSTAPLPTNDPGALFAEAILAFTDSTPRPGDAIKAYEAAIATGRLNAGQRAFAQASIQRLRVTDASVPLGLIVLTRDAQSTLAMAGLEVGDVIVEADGAPLNDVAELELRMKRGTGAVKLSVVRAGARRVVEVPRELPLGSTLSPLVIFVPAPL